MIFTLYGMEAYNVQCTFHEGRIVGLNGKLIRYFSFCVCNLSENFYALLLFYSQLFIGIYNSICVLINFDQNPLINKYTYRHRLHFKKLKVAFKARTNLFN